MNIWENETTKELCKAFASLKTEEEFKAFLDDICTIKEIMDISQRLTVAKELNKGVSYNEISKKTGASTTTISRVSKCYEYGLGGYKTVIERLEKND
ncbi:MAG: DNA-binding transcriptional regulator [Clostridia bacterium]|nr:DNA-binding transcriptional regulator [Clostridia bacterium]